MDWLHVARGDAPLIVAFPHTGTELTPEVQEAVVSPWLARKDADWWLEKLYAFATDLGATTVRTTISRTVIDVNRDPSGQSLYPGQATTELCPTTTFDGEALCRKRYWLDAAKVEAQKEAWFWPYHAALGAEIERLRQSHERVVVYDAHSIRSRIPRLFDGELPQFNIGTNFGATCDPALTEAVVDVCARSGMSHVLDGRFRGGWTTRHYGRPETGVHAIQMELACRGYMDEPEHPDPSNWPTPYSEPRAEPVREVLVSVLESALAFARS